MALALTLFVLAAAAVVVAVFALRWSRDRSRRRAMAERLVQSYEPAECADATLALHNPDGRVAIRADGLCLHLGPPPENLRHVPWGRVKSVVPVAAGRFIVDVSRVGPIEIPGEVGRRLWEMFGQRAEAHASGPLERTAERARAGRV